MPCPVSFRSLSCLLAVSILFSYPVGAQEKDTSKTIPGTPPVVKSTAPIQKNGPKPYKEVITEKAISRPGLFIVHKNDDKWYFEVRDSILGKDILVVNRISKAPINTRSGFFGYAGDEINENVIRFEKGPSNKIFVRSISYSVYAPDTSKPMYRSVMNSNIQPISAAFEIKAFSPDSLGSLIEVTDYLNSDNDLFFFAPSIKSALRLGSLQSDKSYVVDIRNYPINTEIRTVKTYSRSSGASIPGMPAAPSSGNSTFELNTSILLLPSKPMRPRFYDDRVSFLTTQFTDFDADPQGVKDVNIVTRWRLDVKQSDLDAYKRGELVEPVKPITYYIDPATPAKWIPYLIQGVNDWQKAFEKAGFKNAIVGKVAPGPLEDSTWSLEDARYSAIVYKPSDIPNASGPHVHDPRSGEILESHINWYHNVMRLLRNWYLIQAAAVDPRARKPVFSDSLMGQLIRFVSSHEVGHTLGLPHNMGASNATPVEKLRDAKWLEEHGHTASIMDYSRFNYLAQPEDKVGPSGIYPRINDYDLWSIEWGYRAYPDLSEEKEKLFLNTLVKEKNKNPRLRFIHADGIDPRAQTEDLGDNAMKAGEYAIRNLKRIVPELPAWLKEEGKDFTSIEEVYEELVTQYQRYMGHVLTYIGGIYTDSKTTDQPGAVYTIVPKALQKEALAFLQRNVLDAPLWLAPKALAEKITMPSSDRISNIQDNILSGLLSTGRMQRLIAASNRESDSYRIDEYLDDLRKALFTELSTNRPIDNYRRNLQKSFVERLINTIQPSSTPSFGGGIVISFGPPADPKKSDVYSVMKGTLRSLRADIGQAINLQSDRMSKYHLQDLAERIDKMFKS